LKVGILAASYDRNRDHPDKRREVRAMHPYKLRQLIGEFNHLLDTGEYDDVTLDEVRRNIEAGALASFLANRFPGIDVSLMEASDWPELNREWARFANAIDARRKFGVSKRGLCLLLGYAMESLQQRERGSLAA
jgi:hypothetical protein